MSSICPVCVEKWSAKRRAKVCCPYCQSAVCCRSCLERYLLSSSEEPVCVNPDCRHPWTHDFVDENVTLSFKSGRLRDHRESVLVEREMAMMPATQVYVQRLLADRAIRQTIAEEMKKRAEIDARIARLLASISSARSDVGSVGSSAPWASIMKPCPLDGCRGFLSQTSESSDYRCGLCKGSVCMRCHSTKAEDHVCDPADVASVRAISQDSRPCPKCGCMIHRISGCNQMYCTVAGCRTAFDWSTGRIITGRLHNPHYFEFLRQEQEGRPGRRGPGRELDDIPCGGMPTRDQMTQALSGVQHRAVKEIRAAHRCALFVQEHELRFRYVAQPPSDFDSNRDLRVRYLMGEVERDAMKAVLQKRDKKRQKVNAINQVLSTLVNVSSDVFRSLVVELSGSQDILIVDLSGTVKLMQRLRSFINNALSRESSRFACVVPFIEPDWTIRRCRL